MVKETDKLAVNPIPVNVIEKLIQVYLHTI